MTQALDHEYAPDPAQDSDARPTRGKSLQALEAFWSRAAASKRDAATALRREMAVVGQLPLEAVRAIALQYRYFARAFTTDLALLVARCPDSRFRSLLGQLVAEELGQGDPEVAHARLYDCFLESIGAIAPRASLEELGAAAHPTVATLLAQLNERTAHRSPLYAVGMRGLGGECVCGVHLSTLHDQLRGHPELRERADIDWRFWDVRRCHVDLEHGARVRDAIAELLATLGNAEAVGELAAGHDFGAAMWTALWTAVYCEHGMLAS